MDMHLLLIPIQSELASFALAIVHCPPLYSFTKHARFCEPWVVTFSWRHLLFVCRRTSRRQLRGNWRSSCQFRMLTWFRIIWSPFQFLVTIDYFLGSRQLRMLTWFSLIWSSFKFLVIIDYFLGKKHIESTMLCYSPNMRDFASQGLQPFPDDIFNFFVRELVEDNWGKTGGALVS